MIQRSAGSSPRRRGWAFGGLRERLGLALGALIIGASVGLALALAAYARGTFVNLAARNVEALATQMARELSTGMDRFAREIELQALHPVIADPRPDPGAMRATLEALQRTYPELVHVSVADIETARVLAATGGLLEGADVSARPMFIEGRRHLFVGDVRDATRLATLLPRPAGGESLRLLDIAAPVRGADGQAVRVLAAALGWDWVQRVRDRVLQPAERTHDVEILLADSRGAVILPPTRRVAVGTPLSDLLTAGGGGRARRWADGAQYLTVEVPADPTGAFTGLGWRVVARQPMGAVLEPIERLRWLFLAGGLTLGIVAAGLGWLLAGRIVKPVSDLASAAASLQAGRNLDSEFLPTGTGLREVAAVRGAFRRVTGEALSRAERLLEELTSIYEEAPVGLCVVGRDMRYSRVNKVWAGAFGHDAVLMVGADVEDAGAPEALAQMLRQALDEGAPGRAELQIRARDGEHHWHAVVVPLRGPAGAIVGASAVATDVTDIRRAEQALRLADERKNQFVAMLSHELRNPLAPVVTALGILDREPPPAQARRMREMIHKQMQHMVRLIDDLLDVSRVSLNKVTMKFGAVDLREVCDIALQSTRHMFEARGQQLEVHVDPLPAIRGDKARLVQVVSNLLNNASKYGRDGGAARLGVHAEGDCVRLEVADDGRGIAADFLPHVFELFAQGEAPLDRSEGGLGIGLSLVKTLVELHGGRVQADSPGPGQGSTFTVWLPLVAPDDRGVLPEPATQAA